MSMILEPGKSYQLEINPSLFTAPLDKILDECYNIVYIGLSYNETQSEISENIMGEDGFTMYEHRGPLPLQKERQEMFKSWIIKKGVEDLIKAVNQMLIQVCTLIDKIEPLKQVKSSEELKELLERKIRKIEKLGAPELFLMINKKLGGITEFENEILSLNKLRNCLVHNDGITHDTGLNLEYTVFKSIYVDDKGNRQEVAYGILLKGPGHFEVAFEKAHVVFKGNAKIEIDYILFNHLVNTVKLFSIRLIGRISENLSVM